MPPPNKRGTVGLIGFPVKHSLSPVIHNTAIKELGLDAVYEIFEVRPGDVSDFLRDRPPEFLGTNVTIPHKQSVLKAVQELSPVAQRIGAVNTIVRKRDETGRDWLFGDNTDVPGFLAPLQSSGATSTGGISGGNVLILGSGGAARAVAFAVGEFAPAKVTIVARNPAAGGRLVDALIADSSFFLSDEPTTEDGESGVSDPPTTQYVTTTFDDHEFAAQIRAAGLIVNATPIGLTPNGHITPLPDATFRSGQIVYDLVYRPRETRLLQDAKRDGATVIDGTEMLLAQAAASFKQWFGVEMPMDPVREALDRALAEG